MKNIIYAMLVFILVFQNCNAQTQGCLSVDRLNFEKVSFNTLLVTRDGKNIGLISVYGSIDGEFRSVRFFTPTLCVRAPNNDFQINDKLQTVREIKLFN